RPMTLQRPSPDIKPNSSHSLRRHTESSAGILVNNQRSASRRRSSRSSTIWLLRHLFKRSEFLTKTFWFNRESTPNLKEMRSHVSAQELHRRTTTSGNEGVGRHRRRSNRSIPWPSCGVRTTAKGVFRRHKGICLTDYRKTWQWEKFLSRLDVGGSLYYE